MLGNGRAAGLLVQRGGKRRVLRKNGTLLSLRRIVPMKGSS